MRYVCLIYVEERRLDAIADAEIDAFVQRLKQSGRQIECSPLQPVATAATVRRRDGRTFVTDGPFAETKEQLVGFLHLEAADLAEAIAIVAESPTARIGSVEVRPLGTLAPAS